MKREALLLLAFFPLLALASWSVGLSWDESTYFAFTDGLRNWARAGFPSDSATLTAVWHGNPYLNPHPALMKVLSAISVSLFPQPFPLAYRLGHLAFASAALTLSFRLLRGTFGGLAALQAVLFVALQPRLLGELLIGTCDGPVAMGWLALALLTWRLSEKSARGAWAAFYVVYAAITATKVPGLLAIFPALAVHALRRDARALALTVGAVPFAFLVLWLCAPYTTPWGAVIELLSYPLKRHEVISVSTLYLGTFYGEQLPWHAFFVLTAVTLPPLHLLSLAAAPLSWGDTRARALLRATLPFALTWVALGLYPGAPKHDGVRQFVAFFPFTGLYAWLGARALAARFAAGRFAHAAALPLVAALLAVLAVHPFEQGYYSGLIGGLRGAEAAGFEVAYDFPVLGAGELEWLNRELPPGATVSSRPFWPGLLGTYYVHGLLRPDLRVLTDENTPADALVVLHRRSMVPDEVYHALPAAHERTLEGTSLLKIVRKK